MSQMRSIPTGVVPGKFKEMSGFKPPPGQRFPVVCGSCRHKETIKLAFFPGAKIRRIPNGVRFRLGPIGYESTYVLKGKLLTLTRGLQTHRKAPINNDMTVKRLYGRSCPSPSRLATSITEWPLWITWRTASTLNSA